MRRWLRDFRTAWRLGIPVSLLREYQERWLRVEQSSDLRAAHRQAMGELARAKLPPITPHSWTEDE